MPAIENRGEGLFLQFSAAAVADWLDREAVKQRDAALQAGFALWAEEHEQSKRVYPGLPYYMLHSLSHLLLTAISLECGYPSSSIRERVYASPGRYGILIYTGSPDAEGTLGGLVDEGRRITNHMRRARTWALYAQTILVRLPPAEQTRSSAAARVCVPRLPLDRGDIVRAA